MRYALAGGRQADPARHLPRDGRGGGRPVEDALPAALALELVHTFSLVHDDLPAMDDDDERRGRPSAHVAYGEGVALLAGDALLAEAFRLALACSTARAAPGARRGGPRDDRRPVPRRHEGRRRTRGAPPPQDRAAVRRGRRPRPVGGGRPRGRAGPWRAFGEELGLLFQAVDDVIDGDGYAVELGEERCTRGRRVRRAPGARATRRDRRRDDGAGGDRGRPRRAAG